MNDYPLVLVAKENPPKAYLTALDLVGLAYDCSYSPSSLSKYDGLLLVGGGDVFPPFYGKNQHFSQANVLRDLKELKLIDYFVSKKLPILGICRGLQILNVYFGGTLKNVANHQSLNGNDIFHSVYKTSCQPFKNFIFANSNHHQAVDKLCYRATNLLYCEEGEIEGFCLPNGIIATQFHPERMELPYLTAIFGEFSKSIYSLVKAF